jgi:hypothetical protein
MATKIVTAILSLSVNDFDGIYKQGNRFLDQLYSETTLYPTPPVIQADFKAQVDAVGVAITDAAGRGKTEMDNRKDSCKALHKVMGKKLIPYINLCWAGNLINLDKSGAKTSAEPTPVPAPDQPNISTIVRGPDPGSVKIKLVRGVNSSLKKRSKTEYRIFMFEKEEDTKGTEIGSSSNSYKLIGYDVPENAARYFGVISKNTGGFSPLSSKVKFYLLS